MTMTSEEQLAELLKDAGTRLLSPPSSVDDLLSLLDEVEHCLERVDQSPSQTMLDALSPSQNALVATELLGHSDSDVKVYVATCISEITRITAPDAPYSDDQMKEIFQLIVSSFENLNVTSCRSYTKRATILETVAKVRSCVVMLDLECDDLILQMFQHFLKSVRDYHPEKVFSSMERIMTLVLEESEEISPELLSSILEFLKKDNKNVDPSARRLGENVLNKCSSKVEPYLVQAIQTLGVSLDDYSNVVASVCQESSGVVDFTGVNTASTNSANQGDLPNLSSKDAVKEVKETLNDTASQTELSQAPDTLKSTVTNGNLPKVEEAEVVEEAETVEEAEAVEEHLKEQKCEDHTENKAVEDSNTKKGKVKLIIKPQPKSKSNKKRGRKGNMSKTTLEPSEATPAEEDKDAEKVADLKKTESKDSGSLLSKDSPADDTSPTNSDKGADIPRSLPKASENKAVDIPSPSPSGDTAEGSHQNKVETGNKTEAAIQEVVILPGDDSKRESEADVSESKVDKVTGQETSSATDKDETTLGPVDASRKDDGSTIDSDTKTTKLSGEAGEKVESVSDKQDEKKTEGKRKTLVVKDQVKPPSLEECKKSGSPEGATKSAKKKSSSVSSKKGSDQKCSSRKRAADGKEKASEIGKPGKGLVGSKIKVWWPEDKEFYEGVVESFCSASKKHKVVYTDGEVEKLNLAKEKWELVKGDEDSQKGNVSNGENPDASSAIQKKKKIKINCEKSSKQGKSLSAKKRVGGTGAPSSRSKVAVSKPGSKQRDEMNVDNISDDEDAKDSGGSDDESDRKSSDADSGDESMDETPKAVGKSKEYNIKTPKTSTKSKQQTAASCVRSKGKPAKGSASKLNTTGKGKMGSSSLRGKEDTGKKTKHESAKSSQSGKGKYSNNLSKAQKVEPQSGNKRKRGSSKK